MQIKIQATNYEKNTFGTFGVFCDIDFRTELSGLLSEQQQ
jgi:hypothetical protein